MSKKIAVYGHYEAKIPSKQRYWIKRKDGIKQRYWKKTKHMKKEVASGRYEFFGSGRNLQRAVIQALRYPPKYRFVTVSATAFLANPSQYGNDGYWIEKEVES